MPLKPRGCLHHDRRHLMRARACLATELATQPDGSVQSRVSTLRSEAPLMLRLTWAKESEPAIAKTLNAARVCLAAGAAGPIGGDEYSLDIDVGAGSALVLRDISATLLLPGPCGEQSRMRTTIHVAADATLIWLPEPLIAARGCHHLNEVSIELDPGARLLLREELLLGRHGESPGTLRQRLCVRRGSQPLHQQHLDLGPGASGWNTPAVAGNHRALGSALIVDPAWGDDIPQAKLLSGDAALLPLAGPAALVSALAADSLALRRLLDSGLESLNPFWSTHPAPEVEADRLDYDTRRQVIA
jgi:urease accessory protein